MLFRSEYLRNLEKGYWDFFRQLNGQRILVIDTNELDFVNTPGHYEQILDLINRDYPVGLHRTSVGAAGTIL